jgi:ubiquinone/menaquinone biosynthesis C-methylase UbiE
MGRLARQFCEFENHWVFLRPRQIVAELVQGQRVLDVCCGGGGFSAQLAAAGCQVVGVDTSARMLSYAREKRTTAQFELMDATAMPFQHEFDAAVISLALHAVSALVREQIWEAMRRAVCADGRLIALDYSPPQQSTLFARLVCTIIDRDERSYLKSQPEHYENLRDFMQRGGLRAWILAQQQDIERQQDYWGGNIELAVCRRRDGNAPESALRTRHGAT